MENNNIKLIDANKVAENVREYFDKITNLLSNFKISNISRKEFNPYWDVSCTIMIPVGEGIMKQNRIYDYVLKVDAETGNIVSVKEITPNFFSSWVNRLIKG